MASGGGSDKDLSFKLDLDSKEFVEGIESAKQKLQALGEAENLSGIMEAVGKFGPMLGVLSAAILATKIVFDSLFDAEKIAQTNRQFEILSRNAGVSAAELRSGLTEAAGGLATELDILKAANRAVVELGSSASKLPEIMQLARQYTAAFGGDLTANFEQMSHAMATGSQRALRHMGIMVDVNKAHKDYAASLGIAESELSETGKRQAVLNAALEKGKTSMAGMVPPTETATTAWTKFKVSISETTEVLHKAIGESIFGTIAANVVKGAADMASTLKQVLFATIGDESQKAEAKVMGMTVQLKGLEGGLRNLEDLRARTAKRGSVGAEALKQIDLNIEKQKKAIEAAKLSIKDLQHSHEAMLKAKETKGGGGATADAKGEAIDQDKRRANTAKFEADIVKLHEQQVKEQMQATMSLTEYDRLHLEQRTLVEEQFAAKAKEIRASKDLDASQKDELIEAEHEAMQTRLIQMDEQTAQHKEQIITKQMAMVDDLDKFEDLIQQQKLMRNEQYSAQQMMLEQTYNERRKQIEENDALTDQQREMQLAELNQQTKQTEIQNEQMHQAQLLAIDDEYGKQRQAVTERWVQHSKGAASQFAAGMTAASLKAKNDLTNFGAQGQAVSGMMTNSMGNMFMKLGEGSQKGSQIMREALLGMIADVAQYYGQMMLATGIFPPNPPVIAGGAALMALAGFLRGMSHRGSAGGGGGSIGGGGSMDMGGGGLSGAGVGGVADTTLAAQASKEAKSVHLEIHGNLIETDAARRHITEMVRDSLDATDFGIKTVTGVT